MTERELSKHTDYFKKFGWHVQATNAEEEELIEEVKSLIGKKIDENTFMSNESMERVLFKIMFEFALYYLRNKREKEKADKIFRNIFSTLNRELK